MSDYWFKPKTYGYGATPSNWKGWVATIGFVVMFAIVTIAMQLVLSQQAGLPGWQLWFAGWIALTSGLVAAFIIVAKSKTDGAWGWRWGDQPQDRDAGPTSPNGQGQKR